MASTTLTGVLLKGVAASRPAASAVASGTLYSATDTGAITQSDGVSTWSAFATITAGYAPGGTDVALADGGTGATLTDPNADRIMFWDDSAGAVTWLTAGTGLSITTTTIAATGSGTGQGLVDYGFIKRTAGDLTLNSTTWADSGAGTITLTAASGDRVEVGLSGLAANEATNLALDVATIVSAAPVNYLGASGGVSDLGVQSWLGLSGVSMVLGGSVMYALQAGDIDTGTVVLRLQYRTTAATNKTLRSSATQPLHFHAKNLGAAL